MKYRFFRVSMFCVWYVFAVPEKHLNKLLDRTKQLEEWYSNLQSLSLWRYGGLGVYVQRTLCKWRRGRAAPLFDSKFLEFCCSAILSVLGSCSARVLQDNFLIQKRLRKFWQLWPEAFSFVLTCLFFMKEKNMVFRNLILNGYLHRCLYVIMIALIAWFLRSRSIHTKYRRNEIWAVWETFYGSPVVDYGRAFRGPLQEFCGALPSLASPLGCSASSLHPLPFFPLERKYSTAAAPFRWSQMFFGWFSVGYLWQSQQQWTVCCCAARLSVFHLACNVLKLQNWPCARLARL